MPLGSFKKLEQNFDKLAGLLKTTPAELPQRIGKLVDQVKKLEKEVSKLKTKLASGGGGTDFMSQVKKIKGINFLAFETDIDDAKALRDFSDQVKNKIGSGVAVIGSKAADKVMLLVIVSKDLTKKYHAGKLIGEIATVVGGKGGGRPDMAQAGGSQPDKLGEALKKAESLI